MSLITKEVLVTLTPHTARHYENLNYQIIRNNDKWGRLVIARGTKILVKVDDLLDKSAVRVDVECDGCGKELKNMAWNVYLKYVKEDGKYYCQKCAQKLYSSENTRKTKLKNSISFEQWCIENNQQDVLNRWDYELNFLKPNEIGYSSHKNFYFKCPRELHKSELKNINSFTSSKTLYINCKQCNSFAQWGIDNLGDDFLQRYWDYEKNTVDPWRISRCTNKPKVWVKCQEDINHISYFTMCVNFVNNYRCPECNKSKGEKRIKEILDNNFIGLVQDKYNLLNNFNKSKYNYYIPQKEFEGLIGIGNGNLSYDFYLPNKQYNFLIEYQGQQHEKYIPGFHKSKNDFLKQQEHDKRKRDYAQNNNIKLLEIWYWDFDNIESILFKELNLTNSTTPTNISEVVAI